MTGWKPFDPLFAIAVALNIVWSGGHLIWRSATGLLDYSDPEVGRTLHQRLTRLRFAEAHSIATQVEERLSPDCQPH